MKINIANKSQEEVDFIIEAQTDMTTVNAMGYSRALPLIEGDILEIKYSGIFEAKKDVQVIGLKSAKYCNYMNKFAA